MFQNSSFCELQIECSQQAIYKVRYLSGIYSVMIKVKGNVIIIEHWKKLELFLPL